MLQRETKRERRLKFKFKFDKLNQYLPLNRGDASVNGHAS